MAPARTSNRRAPKQQPKQPRQRPSRAAHNAKENNTDQQQQQIQLLLNDPAAEPDPPPDSEHDPIFIDPVFGTPLAIYVEKDVENRDDILDTISVGSSIVLLLLRRASPREKRENWRMFIRLFHSRRNMVARSRRRTAE